MWEIWGALKSCQKYKNRPIWSHCKDETNVASKCTILRLCQADQGFTRDVVVFCSKRINRLRNYFSGCWCSFCLRSKAKQTLELLMLSLANSKAKLKLVELLLFFYSQQLKTLEITSVVPVCS